MKRKFFYLPLFIFCISYFAIAGQNGKYCEASGKKISKIKCVKQKLSVEEEVVLDLSPIRLFMFAI